MAASWSWTGIGPASSLRVWTYGPAIAGASNAASASWAHPQRPWTSSELHRFLDEHRLHRQVQEIASLVAGLHGLDAVHHLHALDDPSEDAIAPGLVVGLALEIQRGIVHHVDEELGGGTVGIRRPRHGHRATFVLQARCQSSIRFVRDGGIGALLPQIVHVATA